MKKFKKEALVIEVDIAEDYYPGDPKYIGREDDKKRNEFLIKSSKENNIEIPDLGGPFHYYPMYISESQMESYYNDALFSIPNMSLDSLTFTLKELEAYSYKELYKALDVLSSRFANEEIMCRDAINDVKRFKNIYKRQFKNQLHICGRVTPYFVGCLRKELQLRNKYLDMLTGKVKSMIDIKMENLAKTAPQASFVEADIQAMKNSHVSKEIEKLRNDIKQIYGSSKKIDLEGVFDNALNYYHDQEEMKEHFKREYEHAKIKHHYKKESFYKALLSVVIKEREVLFYLEKYFEANLYISKNKPHLTDKLTIKNLPKEKFLPEDLELFIHIINELRFEDRFQEAEGLVRLSNNYTLPDRIKALLYFIEFLHANIANFKKYHSTVNEYNSLLIHKHLYLETPETYEAYQKHVNFARTLRAKSEVIYINIIEPIKTKAHSLKICNWQESNSLQDFNIEEIEKLHKSYHTEDIQIICEYERKYAEYRKETNCDYNCTNFFYDLDETLDHLFSFFRDKKVEKESDQLNENANEFSIQQKIKSKQGRPRFQHKEAICYLHNKKLLPFLIDNYSNVKPQVFNQLIKVLIDLQQLKEAENKAYKEAFGEALNVKQSQHNFNKSFNKAPNTKIFDPIKAKIQDHIKTE